MCFEQYTPTENDRALSAVARDMNVLGENQAAAAQAPAIADAVRMPKRTGLLEALQRGDDPATVWGALQQAIETPRYYKRVGDFVRCVECGSPFDCERHKASRRFPTGVDDGYECPECRAWQTDPASCEVCDCCGGIIDDDPERHVDGKCGEPQEAGRA